MTDIGYDSARKVEKVTRAAGTGGNERHRLAQEVGHHLYAHPLSGLVDAGNKGICDGFAGAFRSRNNPRVARVGLRLNRTGALEVATDDEGFHFVISGFKEVWQDVVELDHLQVGAHIFRRLRSVNTMPS